MMEKNKVVENVSNLTDIREGTILRTLDDGSQEEIYVSRAGNVVMNPADRNKSADTNRQQLCWDYYVKSCRDGKPSASGSARKAGYSNNTAVNIKSMAWFKVKMKTFKHSSMMSNAERNFSRILNMQYSKMVINDDGTEELIVDKDILRVVLDASKTVVTHLGKDDGWSTKTEIAGNMTGEIKINSINYADRVVDGVIDIVEQKVLAEVNKE